MEMKKDLTRKGKKETMGVKERLKVVLGVISRFEN